LDVNLLTILLIVFMTMSSSVILLKFWMDFKLSVWDRKNGYGPVVEFKRNSFPKRSKINHPVPKNQLVSSIGSFNNKLSNKNESRDIIIDCEVEVIKR
jgi:hypothetical protein